ncbi:MAG: hypothetical protein ACJAV4_001221 [Pontimonas sp.]|jgi:hypothetical protein
MIDVLIASGEVVNELIFPPVYFGIIFLTGFVVLGMVVFSYRDVANRHRHKTGGASSQQSSH